MVALCVSSRASETSRCHRAYTGRSSLVAGGQNGHELYGSDQAGWELVDWVDRGSARRQLPRTHRAELLETLRVTLKEALELNREEAWAAAGNDFEEQSIAL